MATIQLTKTSNYPKKKKPKYADYKDWLLEFFFYKSCAYCWMSYDDIDVDHYIPSSFSEDKKHDPNNLLISCKVCNSGMCKSDYHHDHKNRVSHKGDETKHQIHNVRIEDISYMFEFNSDGKVIAKPGETYFRTMWNIALFRLNTRDHLVEKRQRLFEAIKLVKNIRQALKTDIHEKKIPENVKTVLAGTLKEHQNFIEKHRLFHHVFDK